MDDMMCWSMTHIQMCRYFIHCYAAIFLHDGFNYCNVLWCHYWVCLTGSRGVCYRTNGVHELPIPLAHFLQWQTWSPYWTFIRPWISMGFTPSLLNKRMTERCSSLVLVTSGTATFYYCVVVLHSCIVLPPVGHSSNHEYNCCQLTRQSSCVSNFYRTFNFFHLTLPRTSKYLGESSLFSERYVVCFTAVTMEIVQNHVSDISHVKPLP